MGMAQPLSKQDMVAVSRSSGGIRLAPIWGGVTLCAIATLAALALWYHYGTTVFFEMIAAGVSACF
jgi:hypothetical protein